MLTPQSVLLRLNDDMAELGVNANEGYASPLEMYVLASKVAAMMEEYKDSFRAQAVAEMQLHGKEAVILGYKVTPMEGGVKYAYTYPAEFQELKKQADAIAKEVKAYEELARKATAPYARIDTETGEVMEVFPAVKSSTSTLKIQ